jgi:hypothetical protein
MENLPSEHLLPKNLQSDYSQTNNLYANNLHVKNVHTNTLDSNSSHIHAQLEVPQRRLIVPLAVTFVMSTLLFFALYFSVVPRLVEQFALANLKPTDVQVMNFNGVYASPSPEGVRHLGESPQVSRSFTSGDFILDLTTQEREETAHGYAKAAHEWYVKTPVIGDDAIIITPSIALSVALATFSLILVLFVSFLLPPSIGVLAALTKRTIRQTRMNLHLQTGLTDSDLDVLCLSDAALLELASKEPRRAERTMTALWELVAHTEVTNSTSTNAEDTSISAFHPKLLKASSYALFRNYCMQRMGEAFSPNIAASMQNLRAVQAWEANRLRFYAALRLFMEEFFAPRFGNVVSGLAYGGAAFLIVSVGLRGLRFIPASRPSVLLFTISLEFAFLLLLGVTLAFQREEASSVETLKRIEQGMTGVSNVIASVDTSVIQRVLQEAAAEYARTPDMQNRVFASIADKAMDAIRAQPAK